MSLKNSPTSLALWTGGAAFFGALLLYFFAVAMARPIDHDEQQFVAAACLWAREGMLPYRDFAYFHTPYYPFVYGSALKWNAYPLLTARSLSVVLGWLAVLVVFAGAWRSLEQWPRPLRVACAFSLTLLVACSPVFLYTTWKAWNHSIPLLLLTAAVLLHWRAFVSARSWLFLFGGACIAAAACTRISYAPFGLPFLLLPLLLPTWRDRLLGFSFCVAGMALATLPALFVFLQAPSAFLFDNFVYNGSVNSTYRDVVENRGSALVDKILFGLRYIINPGNLVALVGLAALGWWYFRQGGLRRAPKLFLFSLGLLPFALLGALAPTPSFSQYFSPVAVLVVLAVIGGLSGLIPSIKLAGATVLAAVICFASSAGFLGSLGVLFSPSRWAPIALHEEGCTLTSLAARGKILTLAPIVILEGGGTIYPQLASGPFGWRTAGFINPQQRAQFHILGSDDLASLARTDPPGAIYLGPESKLEKPLIKFAKAAKYKKVGLGTKRNLWLNPALNQAPPKKK